MSLPSLFSQFPDFQKWVQSKKLTEQHLSILAEFEKPASLKPLIQWIEKHQPSHSQGQQILELGGELILMEKDIKPLLSRENQAVSLIQSLTKHRKPQASARDKKKSEIVKNLNWNPSIKAQWVRQKDKGALSIHFQSRSMRDFKQKLQSLNSICRKLNEAEEKLWKN